ncbi:hypothetical protein EUGRSUZ_B02638 [Eucalyptus grandis]|uniref:NADP-dependent oxidoreductase domain-containing protein n=2 Tax=Eucalyptus grandis TaxID=71139 RepID=A0A059D5U9_EUCGR|nr:hypothetical protein EUGRSUZ_B02638 [Eucalyptus grandis]
MRFGTAEYPLGNTENLKGIVLRAIELVYRHFDMAAVYLSEKRLGEAIAESLELSLVKNLQLEYPDLYLVHWPMRLRPEAELQPKEEDMLPFEMESVWEGMEECGKLGLAKCIGVSNFSCEKLGKLLATAKIPPVVNQVSSSIA